MYLHPLIASVPPDERAAFVQRIELRSYRRNEVVLGADEWTDRVYCVATGLLRVVVQGSEDSGDVTTDFIRQDDIFLNSALVDERYQPGATLVAALPTSLYLVPTLELRALCDRFPAVTMGLLEVVMKRTTVLRRQIRQISSASSERLISRILHELTVLAPGTGGGYDKRITQSVIASYSGLSRMQVNKTMRDLERRGLVRRDEHGVYVPPHFASSDFQELPPGEPMPPANPPGEVDPSFFSELFEAPPKSGKPRKG
ncbi:CRP/FNR family cyclic AMP-dependent transcriptional regulator [Variovorax paradoxus]|uniref:Crp/Fnr family transcriptional regulator n=1 Tax=Variovorax paradoxus TaxID=34073 RepID=UPI0027941E59|nr:Crp/Fnr family transcriptional regulator [Variovorax paradoxus]MDQ0568610.1 CRP/FNR family cyclic AMP-dependent transcriptional regulator [Variovorax paradoxus]